MNRHEDENGVFWTFYGTADTPRGDNWREDWYQGDGWYYVTRGEQDDTPDGPFASEEDAVIMADPNTTDMW